MNSNIYKNRFVSAILLAGGKGKRMNSPLPKQYLPLGGKPLALHSFDKFKEIAKISEIIVVCEEKYQSLFICKTKPLKFAKEGKRRQDSLYSAFLKISPLSDLVAIHDAARPFVSKQDILNLLSIAMKKGAVALGVKATNTIKKCSSYGEVIKTLDRSSLWEIQTPQAIFPHLLKEGFEYINKNNIEVTDDLSIIENTHSATIIKGSYNNFKITTLEDLKRAQLLCSNTN